MSPAVRGTRCRTPRRSGNVLVLFAVFLTGMVGLVAFAVDTGYIALYKTRLQRAADAAALAGAQVAQVPPGEAQSLDAVRTEVRTYVTHNMPGLSVRDEDVKLCRYVPYYEPGNRFSYSYSVSQPANAIEVTLRRDDLANGPLGLFFAPVIGSRDATLSARAVAYMRRGSSVRAGSPLLPYTMQIDYYYAAMGQSRKGVDNKTIVAADDFAVHPTTLAVSPGPDGVNEVVLFTDKQNAPGNFGSLDIGSTSNATGELERQILYGPTAADFANPDFAMKVNPADGALYVPFTAGGDTGLTTSVKTSFEAIKGQPRIIPLYDTVTGTGDGAEYHIVGYAGVVITKVDFTGSQKRLWVQPAFLVSDRVTAADSDTASVVEGVYLPPKLVIP